MCGNQLCFKSVLGVPLQRAVLVSGIIELSITSIATILNVVKYASFSHSYSDECEGKDVCLGPLIKYAVFDALFGVICSLLLIFGAKRTDKCLLICWMVITFFISIKYVYVVIIHDWTALEVRQYNFNFNISDPNVPCVTKIQSQSLCRK